MVFRVIATTIGLFLSIDGLWAQGTTSRLIGTVQDASGAVVAGANVTLTNEGTNGIFTTRSSDAGTYVFDSVQPGTYSLTIEAPGFKKFVAKGNQIAIGQPTTVNVSLQLGAVSEQVEVSGAADAVQTSTSGNIGNLYQAKVIRDLPIVGTRGRNPLDLLLVAPGVNNGGNTGGGVHVNGARDRAWNFTLDGIDSNETSAGGSDFSPLRTNPDSLAEFKVITGNFTADSGRNSGGQVAMVTKSGTNELHGSAFYFYRTPRFNANEWENNLDGLGKAQFVQTIFGGALGGAIVKNRTFYYANGQGLRALNTRIQTLGVLTQQARAGNFRYNTQGRTLPSGVSGATVDPSGNPVGGSSIGSYNIVANDPQRLGTDKTVAALIAATPLPNRFDVGDGLNVAGYTFTAGQQERQHDIVFKIDQILDANNTLYVRYAFGRQDTNCDQGNGGAPIYPGAPCLVNTERTPSNLAINWRSNFLPTVTNEFVMGFNKYAFFFNQPLASLSSISIYGPTVANLALTTLSDYSFGNNRAIRTAQVVDNLSWQRGAHAMKFGFNLRFQRQDDDRGSVGGQNANGNVNFSTAVNSVDPATFGIPADINTTFDRPNLQSTINFLLGRVGTQAQGFVSNGSNYVPGRFSFRTDYPEYDIYGQDTWKVRKNITIDLGLRLEMRLAPNNPDNRIRRPDQPLVYGAAATSTADWINSQPYHDQWKNLGPSLGFAWDPTGKGKTVVRSNYRIAYDRIPTFLLASSVFPNLPGEAIGVVDTNYGQAGGRLSGVSALSPPSVAPSSLSQPSPFGNNTITVADPNLKTPITHQWSFGIQHEVAKNMVVSVDYIGRRAYHLLGGYNANQANIYGNGFLDGFKTVKAGGQSAVINSALSADSRIRAGETASDMIRRLSASDLSLNNVAGLASGFAQRLQNGRSVTDLSGAGPYFFVPFPQFAAVNVIDSNDFSTYNALQVQLDRRYSSGFYYNLNYTWSKALDTRSFDPNFTVVSTGANQSASSTPFDINNRKLNYARSDFDRTHQLKASFSLEVPYGRGKRFGQNAHYIVQNVLGGWRVAGLLSAYTGRPFTVYSGSNTLSNVNQSYANCNGCSRSDGEAFTDSASGFVFYFTPEQRAKFSIPDAGTLGNTSRNFFQGPATFNMDASLQKDIAIRERYKLEIRADATNVTNTPAFGFPTTTFTSGTFGRIRNTLTSSSRKIQLGARFTF